MSARLVDDRSARCGRPSRPARSSARADAPRAFGSATSTPPCIIGAVIMKITSSSIITSIRLTTLISALSGMSLAPAARHARSRPFAHHAARSAPMPKPRARRRCGSAGWRRCCSRTPRDRDAQRRGRRDERLGNARRDRADVSRALRRDADERLDDAEHGAEQSDQRARPSRSSRATAGSGRGDRARRRSRSRAPAAAPRPASRSASARRAARLADCARAARSSREELQRAAEARA